MAEYIKRDGLFSGGRKMINKKYELTKETKIVHGHTLHRIRALLDFGDVKKGALGGWIESPNNLSHDGLCWVYGDARVYGVTG